MKDVTIKCASGEERKILTYIEKKYPNVRWRSGNMPTKVPDNYFYDGGTLININKNRLSCISATGPNYYSDPVVTAEKFLEKDSKPSIVIFRRDRNVIAKDVATGDEGIAKCSPDDEFCFKTGASIALARLMAKTPEVLNHDVKDEWIKVLGLTPVEKRVYTDADRNFKVGDRVVVRDWDDMASEYPVRDGHIVKDSVADCFSKYMKPLCGRTAKVTNVGKYGGMGVEFDDKSGSTHWVYRTWMFNPTDVPAPEKKKPEAKFKVGDHVTLKEGIASGKKYGALTLHSGRMYEYANGKRLEVETATFNEWDGMYHYRCKAADGNYFYYTEAMLDKWDESKICEGDTVKVINVGLNYSSYPQWVGEHISDSYAAARFCYGVPNTHDKYKVLKIAEHENNDRMLAFIEECDGIGHNRCYLIEVKGLEKV